MTTGGFFSLFRRGQHPIRPLKLTGCGDGYCAIQEKSLAYVKGSGQDFWNYWASKGLERHRRPYAVLEKGHPEGGGAYDDMQNMCPVFREKLVPNYDVGVGIAKGAIIFSYMLDRHGLPMLVVKQHTDHSTKDGEATWEPVDRIDKETIRRKDVLVVDLDVLTGKTVRRAAAELRKLRPRRLDLFLRLGPIRGQDTRTRAPQGFDNLFFKKYEDPDELDGIDTRAGIPQGLYDNILFFDELNEAKEEPELRSIPVEYA